MNFTLYDTTGAIRIHGQAPRESIDLMLIDDYPDCAWLEGDYSADTHCVVDGQVTPRTPVPHRLDGAQLSGLPSPCEVHFGGATYRIDGGSVDLAFDAVGTYRVVLRSAPRHLDTTVEVQG